MSLLREELTYLLKLAERCENFDEMINYIKQIVLIGQEISTEERNLLNVAYKNCIGQRITALRIIISIEKKEEANKSINLYLLKEYKLKIETELDNYFTDGLNLIDQNLNLSISNRESLVFFYRMKGDFYRYMIEYAKEDQYIKLSEYCLESYEKGVEIANDLYVTNPYALELFLNFSLFCYEILNDTKKACHLAKEAFDNAIADKHIDENQYKAITIIMKQLRDNLTLWAIETEDQ